MKKKSFSIKIKLLMIALLPAIILSVTLTYLAASNIQTGMQEEALHGLRGSALALREIYDTADPGEYVMDAGGNVMKGDVEVSGHYEIPDHLKTTTEYDVTIFYGDTRVTTSLVDKATGNRLVGTKASDVVIETVLNKGEEYSDTNVVINGEDYYAYYVPIVQNGSVVGMAFAGLPSEEADAFIAERTGLIAGASIIVLLVVSVIGLLFAMKMSKAIMLAGGVIREVGEGNLTVEIDEKLKNRGDELGEMGRELEDLVNRLVDIIGNVKSSSKTLREEGATLEEMANQSSHTTNEISHAVEEVSKGAMTQAEETEIASANIIEMGNVITEIVDSVDVLGECSVSMKKASDESSLIIGELSRSNDRTTQAIEKIGQQVHNTNDSVQAIRQAVDLITSIATETNLLSLNASIEAARAGEHGRGFSVVASQIQKLAEESNKSAQEISTIIEQLLKDSEQTVAVMDEVNVIVNEQREKLEQTKDKFNLVTDGVASTTQEAEVIEKQTTACDAARAKIMDVIQNLSAISEENAASTEETNASMEELNATLNLLSEAARSLLELAKELEESMDYFKV